MLTQQSVDLSQKGNNEKKFCSRKLKSWTTVTSSSLSVINSWMLGYLQCYHCSDRPDHSVLQNAQLTPEEQHPNREQEKIPFTNIHSHPSRIDTMPFPLLLSHGPRWAAAQRRQVWLLLLHLQHEHQAGVLVTEEVQQEHQEVVDDVGLVALSTCVHIDGQARIAESEPLVDNTSTKTRLLQLHRHVDTSRAKHY